MILNTGCRTDIPAFFSEWFYNRVREGYVFVRNPYCPEQVTRYRISPDVVDVLCFCTKNPEPMMARLAELSAFQQFWFVTGTPYGPKIEPGVPNKWEVLKSVKALSHQIGRKRVAWRYDPIFLTDTYSIEYHLKSFEKIAQELSGQVSFCVISFLDLYEKTKRNFPEAKEVGKSDQEFLTREFVRIGKQYGIPIRTCCENPDLEKCGADVTGCMTKEVLEQATGCRLQIPQKKKAVRDGCSCLLGSDIGMYNTCQHGCVYCYANYDKKTVAENIRFHDPASPFLIGGFREGDIIKEAKQESYFDAQLRLF